jgi:hypothetical protein
VNINNNYSFRFPAEWEPQSGVMLIWPHAETDWKPYLDDITTTYLQLADAITRYEKLLLVAQELPQVQQLIASRISEKQYQNIIFCSAENDDTWARDVAPITLIPCKKGEKTSLPYHLLDFKFNGWGDKFAADKDNCINRKLYFEGIFNGILENHKDFILEGGSIESDGKHTLFTTTSCLTAPHRNQPLTQNDLEKRLLMLFPDMQRVVWINHGELQGDDTDGHIDTILRCAPNDTLLYVSTDDTSDPHYDELKALDEQAKSLRTIDGKPYKRFKLPIPKAIFDDGERLPATYANFLILNGAVLVPTYNQPEYDKVALERIQAAFPNYDIIGIDSLTIIRQHGSIHCLTMQFPEGVL